MEFNSVDVQHEVVFRERRETGFESTFYCVVLHGLQQVLAMSLCNKYTQTQYNRTATQPTNYERASEETSHEKVG